MSVICPVCNGLYERTEVCRICGAQMVQAGKMEDYNGPYSPYVDKDTFLYNNAETITGDNCCIHLYECPHCSGLQFESVQLITV